MNRTVIDELRYHFGVVATLNFRIYDKIGNITYAYGVGKNGESVDSFYNAETYSFGIKLSGSWYRYKKFQWIHHGKKCSAPEMS
jgi:hypothetical protein